MNNFLLRATTAAASVAATLLLALPAAADAERGQRWHAKMAEVLELTEEQQQALKQARQELREARREAREQGADSAEWRRDHARQMRQIHEGILTREQIEQLDAMREQGRERMLSRLSERLELHSSQVEPVREVLAASHAEMRAAMRALAQEEGDRRSMYRAARAERERIAGDTREQLAGILTPAQLELFDAMRAERPKRMKVRRRDRS